MTEKAVSIQDMSRIHLIFGDFDNNINIIQKEYKVSIFTRDDEIRIKGDENAVDNAEQVIKTLISTVEKGETPTEQSVRYAISMTNEGKGEEVQTLTADCICVSHTGKPIKAKTVGQSKYVNSIKKNTIVFGVGPAGTGKTYLAVALAVRAFKAHEVQRIILTRPAVEAGEKLGFLPGDLQNKAYYYALKKACKAMNDKISQIEKEKQEYEEYVESFAHEIKIPIGALSLTFDNTKNYALKKETDKLYRLTEQMLYYARSESTEKDYFVKKLNLEEVIHNVILKFRHDLIDHKVIIETHAIDQIVYTDEKWLTFILSQIIQNSIKYFDKQENKLTITGQDNDTNIILSIKDNGCGISSSDLSRVFEKGFTGSDRSKSNSTGVGLYLARKLSFRLGLKLDIASEEKEYTILQITFPKGTVHRI